MPATMNFKKARLLPSCMSLYWWGHKNQLCRAYCLKTLDGRRLEFRELKPAFVGR